MVALPLREVSAVAQSRVEPTLSVGGVEAEVELVAVVAVDTELGLVVSDSKLVELSRS